MSKRGESQKNKSSSTDPSQKLPRSAYPPLNPLTNPTNNPNPLLEKNYVDNEMDTGRVRVTDAAKGIPGGEVSSPTVASLPPSPTSSSMYSPPQEPQKVHKESPFMKMVEEIKNSLHKSKDTHEELMGSIQKEQEKEMQEEENSIEEAGEENNQLGKINRDLQSASSLSSKVKDGSMDSETLQSIFTMKMEIDRLKAQHDALSESRKTVNERFLKVAEDMGSLRANTLTLEKELRDITVRVSRSIDLVEAVQPQKLYSDIKHQDARIETFDGKLEANKELIEKAMGELKDLRSKLSFIKGVEQIVKITEEVGDELRNITKTKALVEQHANKMESMFLEIKTKFSRFEQFEAMGKEMQGSATQALADLEGIKSKADSYLTKDQLELIRNENEEALEAALNSVNDVKSKIGDFSEQLEELQKAQESFSPKEVQERISLLSKRIEEIKKETGNSKTIQLEKEIATFEKRIKNDIREEFEEHYEYVEDRYAQIQKIIKEGLNTIEKKSIGSINQEKLKTSNIGKKFLDMQTAWENKLKKLEREMYSNRVEISKQQKEVVATINSLQQAKEKRTKGTTALLAPVGDKLASMQKEHHEVLEIVMNELNNLKKEMARLQHGSLPKRNKEQVSLPHELGSQELPPILSFQPKKLSKGVTSDKLKTLYR